MKLLCTLMTPFVDEAQARRATITIFLIALFARLAGLALVPDIGLSTNAVTSILEASRMIRAGEFINTPGYPIVVPPFTALFVAALHSVFGEGLLVIKLAQIVLDSIAVLLFFRFGRMMVPYAPAALGSIAVAVYPFAVFPPLYIGTEALFTFFLAAFMVVAANAFRSESAKTFLAAGFMLALCTFTRGTTQYFPVFFLGYLLWKYRDARFVKFAAAFLVGYVVLIGPWTARNVIVMDSFIMSSTPGLALFNGSSEEFFEINDRRKAAPEWFRHMREDLGIPEPENPGWADKDNFYKRAAIEKYKERLDERPASFVPFMLKKFARLFYSTETGRNHAIIFAINLPVYLLGLYGLWLLLREKKPEAIFLSVLLVYFVAIHAAVYSLFRFIVPIMPYAIMLAVHAAIVLGQRHLSARFPILGRLGPAPLPSRAVT